MEPLVEVERESNPVELRLEKEVTKLEESKQWSKASRERVMRELFRRLTAEFGDERSLEIAVEMLRYFPDEVEVISQIAVGYDPAHAVSIARKLTDKAEELKIPLKDPSLIARSIARVVPFHRGGLKRIADAVTIGGATGATVPGQSGSASDGSGRIPADSRAVSEKSLPERARISSVSTATQNTGENLEEPAVPANSESTEQQPAATRTFRIPAASSVRFHTS